MDEKEKSWQQSQCVIVSPATVIISNNLLEYPIMHLHVSSPPFLRLLVTALFPGNVKWSYKSKLVPVSPIGMFFELHRRVGSRGWSVWRSFSWISGRPGLFSIRFWSRWRRRWSTSATEHHGTGRRCFGHYNMVTRPNTCKVRNNEVTWSIIHSQNVLNYRVATFESVQNSLT